VGVGVWKPKFLKERMKLNWNFRRGGVGVQTKKKPSVREVWIFPGTTL